MKSQILFLLSFICIANFSVAQNKTKPELKTEKIKVWGNCSMCKNNIENAAKSAGAIYALWNEDSKLLTVKFDAIKTTTSGIEKKVASVGYDTQNETAPTEVYNKLHGCCQYERKVIEVNEKKESLKSCCSKERSCVKDSCKKSVMQCCKSDGETKECCCNSKEGNAKACCAKDKDCCKTCANKTDKGCCSAKKGTKESCCKVDSKCCGK